MISPLAIPDAGKRKTKSLLGPGVACHPVAVQDVMILFRTRIKTCATMRYTTLSIQSLCWIRKPEHRIGVKPPRALSRQREKEKGCVVGVERGHQGRKGKQASTGQELVLSCIPHLHSSEENCKSQKLLNLSLCIMYLVCVWCIHVHRKMLQTCSISPSSSQAPSLLPPQKPQKAKNRKQRVECGEDIKSLIS